VIETIAFSIIGILFLSGAAFYWSYCNPRYGFRLTQTRFIKLRQWFLKEFTNKETEKIVKEAGLNISGLTYQTIRYLILVFWLCCLIYLKFYGGKDAGMTVAIWIITLIASSPKRKIFNTTSPFYYLVLQLKKRGREKYNLEIFRCLSQLKNLAVAKADSSYSSDYIIKELAKYTVFIRPIFDRFLGYWYESRYEQACKYFNDSIGTEDGLALSNLLLKIDHLKPSEFVNQLELYQNEALERKRTTAQNSKETKSNLVFGVVMVTGIIILLNFLLIAIAIDALGYFKQLSI
jgi:hypothetical protein